MNLQKLLRIEKNDLKIKITEITPPPLKKSSPWDFCKREYRYQEVNLHKFEETAILLTKKIHNNTTLTVKNESGQFLLP